MRSSEQPANAAASAVAAGSPEPGSASRRRFHLDGPGWFWILGALIGTKLVFLCWYGLQARWVMDEFAQGYGAHLVDDGLYRVVDPIKSALPEVLFNLSLHRGLSSHQILMTWRLETLAAALLVVVATGWAAARLHPRRNRVLLSLFVLLTFSNFLEHAFRVRNDSFAILFVVVALVFTLREDSAHVATWSAGILLGLAFLCTQKTAYHALALGLGQLLLGHSAGGWRQALARGSRLCAGFGIPILLYAVAFGGWRFDQVIVALFLSPLRHVALLENYSSGLGRYVVQTLERNFVAYLLCFGGLAVALVSWRRCTWRLRAGALVTALVTLFVFNHQQPWPYVFVMVLPLLALWPPHLLETLPEKWRAGALAVMIVLLAPSFLRNVQYLEESAGEQFALIRDAEAQLAPEDRYFDGIGMIPTRKIAGRYPWWWWDHPNLALLRERWNRGDRSEIEAILADQPKIWILNYRFAALERVLAPIWRDGTVRVSEFLLLTGRAISEQEVEFRNLWPGEYRVYSAHGLPVDRELRVDGAPCSVPCRIALGAHRVASPGAGDAFLLPSDYVPLGPLPHQGPVRDLFAQIYDF